MRTTYAELRTWKKVRGCWTLAAGPYVARLGRDGLSSKRREGDGTTPTGVYRIGATMYGNDPNPGVHFPYRRLHCGDWLERGSALVHLQLVSARGLRAQAPVRGERRDVGEAAPLSVHRSRRVQHAARRPRPGSGIFLHAQTGGPTIGCISLRKPELRAVLRWLRPADAPVIAIGTGKPLRS